MADKLTKQQEFAVKTRGGKLLVSAAAGSGKTKVLVDRLISYLLDPQTPSNIDDFLIITYTKAAASELRSKIGAKLSEYLAENPGNKHIQRQLQRLYLTKISTVHAFCADIIKEFSYELDVPPDFRVADENECLELQTLVLDQLLESKYEQVENDPDFQVFIDSQGFSRNDSQIAEIILKVYNNSRCHLSPDSWLDSCIPTPNVNTSLDVAQTVWGKYLVDDLFLYLDWQIEAFSKCISKASRVEYMEKPVVLFENTLNQLVALHQCKSWDAIVQNSNIDYGRLTFSKKCPDLALAEQMKAVRNACKKGLEKKLAAFSDCSEQLLTDLESLNPAVRGLVSLVKDFARLYSQRKNARRVLDFSDLEQKTLDLLLGRSRSTPTKLATEIGKRFREVMVDEYQDTNEVQDSIFGALTYKQHNCFMVGDVKQSIYQFRLADPSIFIDKYNTYIHVENAETSDEKKVLLSNNFRSSAGVISAVNDVFSNCMSKQTGGIDYGTEEMLVEGIPHSSIFEPEVELYGISVKEDTYYEESTFVAKRIQELLDGTHMIRQGDTLRPITPGDIVILLRSPGSVGAEFKVALDNLGIPCATGSGVDLLQTEEVSVLRSLLQIISNPVQDIPLIAAMSCRVFSFTANELAQIRSGNRKSSFYDAVKECNSPKCSDFLNTLNLLRLDARHMTLPQLIQRIFAYTKMDTIYAAMPDGIERKENLHTFHQLVTEMNTVAGCDLDQFLNYLTAMDAKGLMKTEDQGNSDSVRIMSIHKSKGLEFPVVFLCGLSRGFNQENLRSPVLCDKTLGIGLNCLDSTPRVRYPGLAKRAISAKMIAENLSEEMRVLYVAMTRARDRLIMTYAARNLASDLQDIVSRQPLSNKMLLVNDVDCLGGWILQSALLRIEAGTFFALGGNSGIAQVHEYPWLIRVIETCNEEDDTISNIISSKAEICQHKNQISESLRFQYPYINATKTPSKITATQLKGRHKDHEISENAQLPPIQSSENRFSARSVGGKEFGNVIHTVLQHLNFEKCTDVECIQKELDRLVSEQLITSEQRAYVDILKLQNLFTSPVGKRMLTTKKILREFKFSLLVDSQEYFPDVINERVLMQGVVDCAIIDEDGIIIIDFKTDYVTESSIDAFVSRYSPQVRVYGSAMSKIFCKPIKELILYFFHLDRWVSVSE